MFSSVTVDAIDLHEIANGVAVGNTAIRSIGGLGSPPPRQDVFDRARAHGVVDATRFYGGRVIDLAGSAKGATVAELHDVLDDLHALFALDDAPHVLRFQRLGRSFAERVSFQVASALEHPYVGLRRSIRWAVTLLAPDPRIYSDVLRSGSHDPTTASSGAGLSFPLEFPLDFGATSGNTLILVNEGNFKTPPVWTIRGPGRALRIVNEDSGDELVLDVELTAADFLVVDVAARSVKLGGTVERPDLVDAALTRWWEIPPGSTHVRLVGAGFVPAVSELEAEWRDARV